MICLVQYLFWEASEHERHKRYLECKNCPFISRCERRTAMNEPLTKQDIKDIDRHIRYLALKRDKACGEEREHLENIIHWLLRYERTCKEDETNE